MIAQQPLLWHQGLFLQPQHFQLQERVTGSLLAPLYGYANAPFWGVGEMAINLEALDRGTVVLDAGAFLFQDGSYTVLKENAVLQGRSFRDQESEGSTVYIGIRKWNRMGENTTLCDLSDDLSGVTTRLVASGESVEVPDLHAGGPPAQVKRQHYLLKLFWESEMSQLGEYHLIPLARLQSAGGTLRLKEDFIPPCLSIGSCRPLTALAEELRDLLACRSKEMEEYKRERGMAPDAASRDVTHLLALRTLNRYLPLLFQTTEQKATHPLQFYGLLRQLAGELSTFSAHFSFHGECEGGLQVSPYRHHDLSGCFSVLRAVIETLVEEITAGPDFVFPLVHDGTYFSAQMKPALFETENRYYLVLHSRSDQRVLLNSLESAAKVSTAEQLPVLVTRALSGIPFTHLTPSPQQLPRRGHTLYLALDHHCEQWTLVAKECSLSLYWDEAPPDLTAELMVLSGSRN